MATLGLVLGLTAIALGVALTLIRTSPLIGLSPLLEGAVVVSVALGLGLSALALVRRRGRTIRMPLTALAVNVVGLGAVLIIILGQGEPTFNEAMLQLVEDSGVAVQRITGASVGVPKRVSRPALIVLPSEYYSVPPDEQSSIPLVLSLHGYSSHYMDQDSYFGLSRLVNSYNFALVLANGTMDDLGNRFWNATDFCCGITDTKPDDVVYLTGLVEEAAEHINIDRVFVTGMSNGGFMAYRLACDGFPGLAGIVVVAGSSFSGETRCDSANPVSVLHVHGNADEVVSFEGGSNPDIGKGNHAAARDVVHRWARRAGCDLSEAETLPNLDIDWAVDGSETSVTRYLSGCRDGLVVELWEMDSSSHVPQLSNDFGELVLGWMFGGLR